MLTGIYNLLLHIYMHKGKEWGNQAGTNHGSAVDRHWHKAPKTPSRACNPVTRVQNFLANTQPSLYLGFAYLRQTAACCRSGSVQGRTSATNHSALRLGGTAMQRIQTHCSDKYAFEKGICARITCNKMLTLV